MKAETIINILEWSEKNPIFRNILWYLFFPITFPMLLLSKWFLKWATFKNLDKAIEAKDENGILQICATYLKYKAVTNEWKSKISKKWFSNTMRKHERKMYEYCSKGLREIKFDFFRTMIDVYLKYNIIGGSLINKTGDTIIKINE